MQQNQSNFSNRGNQNNFPNQINNQSTAFQALLDDLEYHASEVEKIQEAIGILDPDWNMNNGGSGGGNGGNSNNFRPFRNQQGGRGNNFGNTSNTSSGRNRHPSNSSGTTSDGSPDMRLSQNREAYGSENIDLNEINPGDIEYNQDGSVDLRTKIGRVMQAEGWVDDDGFQTDSFPSELTGGSGGNRGKQNNFSGSGRGGNRGSSRTGGSKR